MIIATLGLNHQVTKITKFHQERQGSKEQPGRVELGVLGVLVVKNASWADGVTVLRHYYKTRAFVSAQFVSASTS
jgi:hypothetical protein